MNRNQFALLCLLLVILGLAGLVVYHKQNEARSAGNLSLGQKLLGELPVNDVTHIALKQNTNEVNLVKKDGSWRVRERNDYPASFPAISEFLLKAADLKIVQSERVGPSQLPRLELVPGQGTNAALEVDLKDQTDKPIRTLLLGKKHLQKSSNQSSPLGEMGEGGGWPDGRWIKVGSSPDVALVADALSNLEPKPDQWLNKDFFKVDKVRAVAVTFPAATNSWKVTRETETGEWKLADAKPDEKLDSAKTSALSNPLSSPSFNDVDIHCKPDQMVADKTTVVALDTFDNFTYTLKVGQKTNDAYPLAISVTAQLPKERTPGKDEKAEDKAKLDKQFQEQQKKLEDKLAQEKHYEPWVYLVSSWTLDPLLKDRAQLMVEKKKDEPKKEGTANSSPESNSPPASIAAPPASDDSKSE